MITREEDADQIKLFIRRQVNALLERTHAQAQAGIEQAVPEQAEDVAVRNVEAVDERDKGASRSR